MEKDSSLWFKPSRVTMIRMTKSIKWTLISAAKLDILTLGSMDIELLFEPCPVVSQGTASLLTSTRKVGILVLGWNPVAWYEEQFINGSVFINEMFYWWGSARLHGCNHIVYGNEWCFVVDLVWGELEIGICLSLRRCFWSRGFYQMIWTSLFHILKWEWLLSGH